ncbi:MAG: hypothetical protein R6U13_07205 [Desulfatiglandaceae bacterium]
MANGCRVAPSDAGRAGGSAAGASYFVVFHEEDMQYRVGAVFNRDKGIGTDGDWSASFGSFTEATHMAPLLRDESPASKLPPQPLFGLR